MRSSLAGALLALAAASHVAAAECPPRKARASARRGGEPGRARATDRGDPAPVRSGRMPAHRGTTLVARATPEPRLHIARRDSRHDRRRRQPGGRWRRRDGAAAVAARDTGRRAPPSHVLDRGLHPPRSRRRPLRERAHAGGSLAARCDDPRRPGRSRRVPRIHPDNADAELTCDLQAAARAIGQRIALPSGSPADWEDAPIKGWTFDRFGRPYLVEGRPAPSPLQGANYWVTFRRAGARALGVHGGDPSAPVRFDARAYYAHYRLLAVFLALADEPLAAESAPTSPR